MKSPKPIVAGAIVAGGLLFTSAAAALTLPDEAAESARTQVGEFLGSLPDDAASAGEARRQVPQTDETEETAKTEAVEADEVEVDKVDDAERPETHGAAVSALATSDATKELDGRERGEEISNLARTNGQAERGDDAEEADEEAEEEEADDDRGSSGRQRATEARQGR